MPAGGWNSTDVSEVMLILSFLSGLCQELIRESRNDRSCRIRAAVSAGEKPLFVIHLL